MGALTPIYRRGSVRPETCPGLGWSGTSRDLPETLHSVNSTLNRKPRRPGGLTRPRALTASHGGSSRSGLPGRRWQQGGLESLSPAEWAGHLPRAGPAGSQGSWVLPCEQAQPVMSHRWAGLLGPGSPADVREAEGPHVPLSPGSSGAGLHCALSGMVRPLPQRAGQGRPAASHLEPACVLRVPRPATVPSGAPPGCSPLTQHGRARATLGDPPGATVQGAGWGSAHAVAGSVPPPPQWPGSEDGDSPSSALVSAPPRPQPPLSRCTGSPRLQDGGVERCGPSPTTAHGVSGLRSRPGL